ncbi:MAG: alpha/beta hydrolase [Proteobacteria bacterium]|nr:alpha/beta hydrolase [Pseudomonadota bacterium]
MTTPPPEAGYAGPTFCWIHAPRTPTGTALVIVPPFGYEAVCAHRSLRHLAEDAAAKGMLAIRFDLDGTGDSANDDLQPARADAWLASITAACDLARARGAERLVLVGVRLGAALACLAAEPRDDVAGVVAIAPTVSGKGYVRELKMLQGALGLAPAPHGVIAGEVIDEAIGFPITPETRLAIAAIDLAKPARRPAPAVLVLDRDDLPASDRWIAALGGLGVAVEHARLPGYVEMVLDPHHTKVPTALFDATLDFAARRSAAPETPTPTPVLVPTRAWSTTLLHGGVREELVRIDDALVAIVSRPATTAPPRRAVILLNSGAIHRIGPNRLYVDLARRLAARGELVVRADLSGMGDSRPRPGAPENVVYSDHAVADVGVLVAWARRQGATTVAVGGVCAGAYHAIKAAVAGQPIDAIVPINPLTFFWKPGMPLDFAAFRVTSEAARYADVARSSAAWKKLLRGDVNVRRVAEILLRRARDVAEHRGRDVLRRLRVPLPDDLGTELLQLARAGIAVRFIFADEDPGRAMLREQGGSAVARLVASGQLAIDVIEGPDHTFTPRWSHPLLLAAIERALTP